MLSLVNAVAGGIVQAVTADGLSWATVMAGAAAGAASLIIGWLSPNANPGQSTTRAVLRRLAAADAESRSA